MISKVKPLHAKVEETTAAVEEAEHRLMTLENKKKVRYIVYFETLCVEYFHFVLLEKEKVTSRLSGGKVNLPSWDTMKPLFCSGFKSWSGHLPLFTQG